MTFYFYSTSSNFKSQSGKLEYTALIKLALSNKPVKQENLKNDLKTKGRQYDFCFPLKYYLYNGGPTWDRTKDRSVMSRLLYP